MRLFAFLSKDKAADWLPGTCASCGSPLDEHACRVESVYRSNRRERRATGIALVVETYCNGRPIGRIVPCPCCAAKQAATS